MSKYLMKKTFSLNSKKPARILRKNREFQNNLVAANIVNKNFPDINKLKARDIEKTDLLTYSFPCQGLSIANMGRGLGIKENVNSTSNLIWQIKRLLDDVKFEKMKLPKYLLLENVKSLIGKTHIKDYNNWKEYLSSIGYETYTIVLNGLNHNSLQRRKRVFGLSILNGSEYIKNDDNLAKIIDKNFGNRLLKDERMKKYFEILNSSTDDEILDAIPNDTRSRRKMAKENVDLELEAENRKYIFNTLTTKQDRHPNIGMIKIKRAIEGKLNKRFITYSEAYQIMGFDRKDIENVKKKYNEKILTKESLYRQAGNSIIVSVLEDLFKLIFEIDNQRVNNDH